MKTYSIPRASGDNLREIISRLLVKSPTTALKELVCNSYDADAGNVRVQILDQEREIVVEDDGIGMDEIGLERFLSMGDSEKLGNPVTNKGRRKIGKFGIANTLLQFLGESYRIQTWTGDSFIDGVEEFTPTKTGGIRYSLNSNPDGKHGTCISIQRSRFVGSRLLKLDRLEDALAWELPEPNDDFKITLNGREVKRVISEPLEVLEFHDELNEVGEVDMRISIYDRPVKINGLYVYVDKRTVGDSEVFQLKKVLRISPTKVLITVTANGLRESVVFNREKLIEDAKFLGLRTYIHKRLYGIGKNRSSTTSVAVEPSRQLVADALSQTGYLNGISPTKAEVSDRVLESSASPRSLTASSAVVNSKCEISTQQPSIPQTISGFKIVTRRNVDSLVAFNPLTRQLTYNQKHPLISSPEITSPDLSSIHILLATALGVAEDSFLSDGGPLDYTTSFNASLAKVLTLEGLIDSVTQSGNSNESSSRFAPSRDYSLQSIMAQGIVTRVAYNALVRAGVFNPREEMISGKELNDYVLKSANHTPAVDLVWYEWGSAQVKSGKLTKARVGQLSQRIDEKLTHFVQYIPFLYNIGVRSPFFLVENEHTPKFLGLLAQGVFSGAVISEKGEDLVQKKLPLIKKIVGESTETKFAPLEDLCEVLRGSPHEVMLLIGYSQKHGLNIPSRYDGERVFYSVPHFKKARLKYLEREK